MIVFLSILRSNTSLMQTAKTSIHNISIHNISIGALTSIAFL